MEALEAAADDILELALNAERQATRRRYENSERSQRADSFDQTDEENELRPASRMGSETAKHNYR